MASLDITFVFLDWVLNLFSRNENGFELISYKLSTQCPWSSKTLICKLVPEGRVTFCDQR